MEKLIEFLREENCYICNNKNGPLCYECLNKCKCLNEYFCIYCQNPSIEGFTHPICRPLCNISQIFCPFEYCDTTKEVIVRSKFQQKTFILLKKLSDEGAKISSACLFDASSYILVPIPSSRKRYDERGFNHANIICRSLEKEFGAKTQNLLARPKYTEHQYELSKEERQDNLKDAFLCKENLTGKNVLLVDDICTTGSTFMSAAKELFRCGAKDIKCFALSRKTREDVV